MAVIQTFSDKYIFIISYHRAFTDFTTVAPLWYIAHPAIVVYSPPCYSGSESFTRRRPAPASAHLETNLGSVFRGWSFKYCPYYEGSIGVGVRRWLNTLTFNLKNRQAHTNVWHLAGIRLLQGKAYADYGDSTVLGTAPEIYNFPYHEKTGFVTRLNKALNRKMIALMHVEEWCGNTMTFSQIVVAAFRGGGFGERVHQTIGRWREQAAEELEWALDLTQNLKVSNLRCEPEQ
ncbi:uncharacterized protein VP01_349g11 [Puccinia sorghi]|uniref:Uncharacterized protein n=1 Tax=Puccinia sorghi TaxID=27349 RepID=A0A0L6UVP9_9BASI|nr:uncharacterized protein VP01_349g11 [Puccinia sorghi]